MSTSIGEFTFKTYSCDCFIQTVLNDSQDDLNEQLICKINKNSPLKLAYQIGYGLKLTNSKKKNNPLGEFLGIKKDDSTSVKSFLENYGPLVPLEGNTFTPVNLHDFDTFRLRLLSFVNLINFKLQEDIHTFRPALDAMFYLLFNEKDNQETFANFVGSLLRTSMPFDRNNKYLAYVHEETQQVPYYKVNDWIYQKENLIPQEQVDQWHAENSFMTNISSLYILKDNLEISEQLKLVIDFIFHFYKDYTFVTKYNINIEDSIFEDNLYEHIINDKPMYNSIKEIINYIIASEFETELKNVTPTYDVKNMQPSWILPDLKSALYFSVFYKNSDCVFRKCANANCLEYFEVSKTNNLKKYCSTPCKNSSNQRSLRYNKSKGH